MTDDMTLEEFIKQKQQERRKQQQNAAEPIVDMSYITVEEYAKKMNIHENTVRIQCSRGDIPNAVKRGHRWYVPVKPAHSDEDFGKLLEENARLKATLNILKNILHSDAV